MAHLFNRMNWTHKWLTYILTIITLIIYSILFDVISNYFEVENTGFLCKPPTVMLPILFSPILILIQMVCNVGIIKTIKFEKRNDDGE